jgi:hypothetical protein
MTVTGEQLRIAHKNPCRVATTANISDLAAGAPDPLDGVNLAVNDRVLVKDQSTGAQNGIYRVVSVGGGSNGQWARAPDFDETSNDRITAGLSVYIQEGSLGATKTFRLTTTGTIVLDSTSLTFTDVTPPSALTVMDEVIYVNKAGNDSDSGKTVDAPKLTIASAITAASAQSPAAGKRIEIRILGGNTYTENLALPDYVSINGPEAILSGHFTSIGTGCRVKLQKVVGTATTLFPLSSEGDRYIEVEETEATTATHILTSHASAIGTIRIGTMTQLTSGSVLGATAGVLQGFVDRISVVGATAVVNIATTGIAVLDINRMNDNGSGTGINHAGTATIYLNVRLISCNTTYAVTDAGGELNLFVNDLVGTPGTITGTANVSEPGSAGGIGGTTGSTDNAILRADGAGGSTVQSSVVTIDDTTGDMTFPDAAKVKWGDGNTWIEGDGTASTGDLSLNAADNIVFQPDGVSNKAAFTDKGLILKEQADPYSHTATFGAFWVRDDAPAVPMFSDDDSGNYNLLAWSPVKRPCVVATTADVADLATGAPDPVDGVSLSVGDRILVWQQDDVAADPENGIYVVDSVGGGSNGQWSRAADFDIAADDHIEAGVEVYVQQGDLYGQTKFYLVGPTTTIIIDSSDLEFIPEGGLARTDATSTEIIASTAFTNGTFIVNDSGFTTMRDHTHIAVYFDPTDITTGGSVTEVDIVVFWSDDGSTIPFATDDNIQQSDFDIVNQADGTFHPQPYTAQFTTAGGELAANKKQHLVFPKGGGACKVGVKGNAAGGAFSVRIQRLVQ